MTWLEEWVRTIIILVFFAGFLELLLPSGNMKPTVQVLVGLFVLVLLLGPVSSLVAHIRNKPEFELPRVAEAQTEEVLARGEDLREKQLDQILIQYRENVKQQVESLLKLQDEQVKVTVEVEVVDQFGDTNFGQLRSLTVTLQTDQQQRRTTDTEKLTRFLSEFYGLSKDKVTVVSI